MLPCEGRRLALLPDPSSLEVTVDSSVTGKLKSEDLERLC